MPACLASSPGRKRARRGKALPGGIPGVREGLQHHAGSAVGRGCRGHYRRCGQATTPGEDAALAGGTAEQSGRGFGFGSAPAASAATTEAATGDEGSATGESPATSERSSTAAAGHAGSAAAAAVQTENPTETGDVIKKHIEVSFSIIGTDADGKAQTWVAPTQLKLDEGATAADAFIKLLEKTGFKAKYDPNTAYGFYL
ncbi:MAG: hypothetical protein ACLUQW_08620, partial [Collinsella sp.]